MKDLDEMFDLQEQFWLDFSKLCNDTLDKLTDQAYRDELEMMLSDSSSVYGRKQK